MHHDIGWVIENAPEPIRQKWRRSLTELGKRINYGVRPHERDWDVLVVLDACRWDLFHEFAPTHPVYTGFTDVETVYSCASSSDEWLLKSFENAPVEFVRDVCYVTANAYTYQIDLDRFAAVDEVWKYARHPETGTTFPAPVTNQAIRMQRRNPDKRLVVHYFQPHAPFLHCLNRYVMGGDNQHVWEGIQKGEYARADVWRDYGQNLLSVLDHVDTLIEDLDGRIAVTADHGNLIGEWGLYGHPSYVPLPALKRVPWAAAMGRGKETFEVQPESEIETVRTEEPSIKEHLRQLGYVE